MNFDDAIQKLKGYLVEDKYNVLGYSYTDKQAKNLLPWIFNKKKKEPVPPEVGQWMDGLGKKYPLVGQMKKKIMGQWAGPYYFAAVRADGLDAAGMKAKLKEYETDMLARGKFYDKGSPLYELEGRAMPAHLLAFIFEKGASDEQYLAARNCYEGLDVHAFTRPYAIDLKNQRCDRGEGRGGGFVGTPNPKDMVKVLFK